MNVRRPPGRRAGPFRIGAALLIARAILFATTVHLLWSGSAGIASAAPAAATVTRLHAEAGDCILEAPPELRALLEALASRAAVLLPKLEAGIGVRPAGPFRILLIPPGRIADPEIAALDEAGPPWAAGFVLPGRRVGAIRVALADRYPYSDLGSVLIHEVVHILLHDAAGPGLPRWFEEGVATGIERSWGLRDAAVWTSTLLTGPLPELRNLGEAFEASGDRARAAYAASFDFMSWAVRRHGEGLVRDVVREAAARGAAGTVSFAEAWQAAAGTSLAADEATWRRTSLLVYRWLPVLTGSGVLWGGITLLVLVAGARRRARSRAILQRFEQEERWERRDPDEDPPRAGNARDIGFFRDAYEGAPPWDTGRPQPEFARLAEEGAIRGGVLDLGCGTGENALHLAGLGLEVWGIDGAPIAIDRAIDKARERGLTATFLVGDALHLEGLGRAFDTIIDSGLFHVFTDDDRRRYVRTLSILLKPGGRLFLLCFSDREPGTDGPRRVTRDEIRAAFRHGFEVESIREARFATICPLGTRQAWLATIARR